MTASAQSAVESHTSVFHANRSYQAACLVDSPRLRANSGKHDGRDFNNRGGERGRQAISFRSCAEDSEHTDQEAAQVPSPPPGPLADVKAKLMEIRKKVDRNRARWFRLGYEWFVRRTILLASEGRRQASCRKIAARP